MRVDQSMLKLPVQCIQWALMPLTVNVVDNILSSLVRHDITLFHPARHNTPLEDVPKAHASLPL